MAKEQLIWKPPYEALEERFASDDSLIMVISPFIGLEALGRVLEEAQLCSDLKILVRLRAEDIRTGVTDIEIYPYLTARNVPLYINGDIHLKLYIFESNCALNTSANVTMRGLGYAEKSNIEVGQFVNLEDGDWLRLYSLFEQSRRVDNSIYLAMKEYRDECAQMERPPYPELILPARSRKYSLSSLPSLDTPLRLFDLYFGNNGESADELRRFAHDITVFGIEKNQGRHELEVALRNAFRSSPFVGEFVALLKQESELRFGSVASWIHNRCEDVPLPYRWEIKESTRRLYNWLEFFFDEIKWTTPNYSQVINWTDKVPQ
jgi:hypothetical protein